MRTRCKGQISAEMIIILAILLGVVLLIANKMRETASTASAQIQISSNQTFKNINQMNEIGCNNSVCKDQNECCSGFTCSGGRCLQ